jgi:SSS family solute:Na+ symporter
MSVGLIAVTVLILANVGWERLVSTVSQQYGVGGFNPFVHPKMGWQYVAFNAFLNLATVLTWQTTIARVLASKNTATGLKIYRGTSFFFVCRFLIPGIWGIAALAMFAPGVVGANTLHAMPRLLATIVPTGLMGILIAAMLAADMSTDSSYMLTWASVIYNDILAPFRKKTWSEKRGLKWNRMIVALIGIFLLLYGLWYPLKGDLWTYLGVTGTIYLSSMSVVLIACCYWKGANNWGAGAAIVAGAVIPVTFLILQQVESTRGWTDAIGPYYSGIATYIIAGTAMVAGSLLKRASLHTEEEA